jgi:glutathione synthase/RimK-type ligase-like ATP-grasp enzyme
MFELAFATCQQFPEMNSDDRLVADALGRKGINVISAVWDAPNTDWSRFDGVVIRSTWDYHLAVDRYAQWLRSFSCGANRLWNPPEVVLPNLNKRYLGALAGRGIEVVPTKCLAAGGGRILRKVLEDCGWKEAVIKPTVSASAHGTWRTSLATADADQSRFAAQIHRQDLLIQPYLAEIAAPGEWSFVFFGGRYSHAVLKRPAAGDFRVQREYGGSSAPAEPATTLIDQAQNALAAVDQELLYARVDGVERHGRLVLMELEINEPFLFIGFSEGAAERFAEAC